jgi:hypothetical protein
MRALLALGCCLAAVAAAEKTTRALPPFSSLNLGRDGCMPVGVRVVEGDYALEIVAEARYGAAPPPGHEPPALRGFLSKGADVRAPARRRAWRRTWQARCRRPAC